MNLLTKESSSNFRNRFTSEALSRLFEAVRVEDESFSEGKAPRI